MSRRINWEKGMRLTDDIMRSADNCNMEYVGHALALAAAGRFGLLPSSRPFHISVGFTRNRLEIKELNCLAITRDGSLIDVNFDTRFNDTLNAGIPLPSSEDTDYLLIIYPSKGKWINMGNGYCEPSYEAALIDGNDVLPADAFPVAKIVNDPECRLDDADFLPPHLFVASSDRFADLAYQFRAYLSEADRHLRDSMTADCRTAMTVLWPALRQMMISMDKDIDLMTPMAILGNIQKYVAAFVCGCALEPNLHLENSEIFDRWARKPYDYRTVYADVREGLGLCAEIDLKLEKFKDIMIVVQETAPAPVPDAPVKEPEPDMKRRLGWMGIEI